MEIRNCPECGGEAIRAGLAFWPDIAEPVEVAECESSHCGWVGVESEHWAGPAILVADAA